MSAIASTARLRTNRIYPRQERVPASRSLPPRLNTDAANVDIRLDLFSLSILAFDFVLLVSSNGMLPEQIRIVQSPKVFQRSHQKVGDGFREMVPCFIQAFTSFSIAYRSCGYNVRSNVPGAIQKIIERSLPLCVNGVV